MLQFLARDVRLWLFFKSIWVFSDRSFFYHLAFLIMQRERGGLSLIERLLYSWTACKVIRLSEWICVCNSANFCIVLSACNSSGVKSFISAPIFLNRCTPILLKRDRSTFASNSFWSCSLCYMALEAFHIRVLSFLIQAYITLLWEHYNAIGTSSCLWQELWCHSSLTIVLKYPKFCSFFLPKLWFP